MASLKNTVQITLAQVEKLLLEDKSVSVTLKLAIKALIGLVHPMAGQLGLKSNNSSIPPSQDPNRTKKPNKEPRKRGGQPGHKGSTLRPYDEPDETTILSIDRRSLPRGNYQAVGFERRQVVDIIIRRHVTEYAAEILQDAMGNRFVASFPEGVTRPIQYGSSVRANAVFLSMGQLIPYDRVEMQFADVYHIPVCAASIVNFNHEAFDRLKPFEDLLKQQLIALAVAHADETGINLNGKRTWLHDASNDMWTYFYPHEKRGTEAMVDGGVIPNFKGTLVHDHWRPYYTYECTHALCNAHHLRELIFAHEMEKQAWALKMHTLLLDLNKAVIDAGGSLNALDATTWRQRYRSILDAGDNECPPPAPKNDGTRGRTKRSKSRNLLERLRKFEDDTLRFMVDKRVPFTNNQGERDIRMTKVQQKISGSFRSMDGAKIFCRIRSYLSTCQKHDVGMAEALNLLFIGKWPTFIKEILNQQAATAE